MVRVTNYVSGKMVLYDYDGMKQHNSRVFFKFLRPLLGKVADL